MFARQWSIICTFSLVAFSLTAAHAVEFVVSDNGKPTATKIPATPESAAPEQSLVQQVGLNEMTDPALAPMDMDMLTAPGSGISYPDPSAPFSDELMPPDVPEMTVPLEPQAIHDPAGDGYAMPSASACDSCGETSFDGSCGCQNSPSYSSGAYQDFAPSYGSDGGCSGGNCGCGHKMGLFSGLGSMAHGLSGGLGSMSGCGGCQGGCNSCGGGSPGWFLNLWVAGGYTYNADDPNSGSNLPQTFNDRSNDYLMNQTYLSFGKAVSTSSWDLGGRVDVLYGTDYFFTQANGLETNQDGSPHWNSDDGPRGTGASLYGLALPQAYLELGVPFGAGTSIKFGHFYTTLGYESVMAPENFFYSHAYTMQYGEPFTHTGALADIGITQSFNLLAGITNGWDQFEDPNDELGYLLGFSWCPSDVASVSFGMHSGREDAAGLNDRTVYSMVYTRQVSNRLQYVMQHDFGTEANAETDRSGLNDSAKWYGINQYLFYEMSEKLTLGARVEWFRDQDNARVLGIPNEALVEGGNYFGLSLGANFRPSCRWIWRPEIRWDYSDVAATGLGSTGMYNDFTDDNQFTLASDIIFRF